ncbi:hypothetical protein J2X61_006121 [Bacillus sp. 3255]|nr:hypothetical protein [Bacillus sp. 3255]
MIRFYFIQLNINGQEYFVNSESCATINLELVFPREVVILKKMFVPTCRVCEKLNDIMTHCAIYGPVAPENVDSPVYARGCLLSGEYVRLIHAVPNEHNYIDPKQASDDFACRIYSHSSENESFSLKHGITLEEWAKQTFSSVRGDSNDTNR